MLRPFIVSWGPSSSELGLRFIARSVLGPRFLEVESDYNIHLGATCLSVISLRSRPDAESVLVTKAVMLFLRRFAAAKD